MNKHWITLNGISFLYLILLHSAWVQQTMTLPCTEWKSKSSKIDLFSGMKPECSLSVSCRPASSECTEPLWTTTRLLWRRWTSAARPTLSLHRYLRYVIRHCSVGHRRVLNAVQLPETSDEQWWEQLQAVFTLSGITQFAADSFFLPHFSDCYLLARISKSKAQRTAKTSQLKIHWKVSIEWNKWPAPTWINIGCNK